jgi:hypothetical protein
VVVLPIAPALGRKRQKNTSSMSTQTKQ